MTVTDKYKAGDIIHVVLTDDDSKWLNAGADHRLSVDQRRFIAHIPAPKPVVRYVRLFEEECRNVVRFLRLEWPDGDTSKNPVVTVEDV